MPTIGLETLIIKVMIDFNKSENKLTIYWSKRHVFANSFIHIHNLCMMCCPHWPTGHKI